MRLLKDVAYARSGDKGSSVNVAVFPLEKGDYHWLEKNLTSERVAQHFQQFEPTSVKRYEVPNLDALNFVIEGVLGGGGSRCLRTDSQGKAFGQLLLELEI